MTWGGNPFFKNSLLRVCRLVTHVNGVSGNVCTCNFCVNYSLVSRPPPDFFSQLCCFLFVCFCLFVCLFICFCLFVFVCLFFPQLWDTRSGLATRLASCHPSCAQLYQNVSDILPPARAALLHNSQTSVHNNIAPVPLLSDLFCPTLNLLLQIAPGETCAKVQFILIQERAWEILFRNCLLFSVQSSSHKIVVSNPISCQLYQFIMFHILRLHAAMW